MTECYARWLPGQLDPINIFLVTSGSTGEKLLFRFPLSSGCAQSGARPSTVFSSPSKSGSSACPHQAGLRLANECYENGPGVLTLLHAEKDAAEAAVGLTDETLASILSAKAVMAQKSFEIKIDDVVFLGYSESISDNRELASSISTFCIIFAVQCGAPKSINKCYIQLAKQLTTALRHEEQRCCFLTDQQEQINQLFNEIDDCQHGKRERCDYAVHELLTRSPLCNSLASVFKQLRDTGRVRVRLNGWVPISFCLAHKMHRLAGSCYVLPEAVEISLKQLQPYHCLLLLHDLATIGASIDCNPLFYRFLRALGPHKSLQEVRLEADVTYSAALCMAQHLVLWGFAIITCPISDSNMYVLNPRLDVVLPESPKLAEEYLRQCGTFGQQASLPSLAEVMAAFSLHSPLGDLRDRELAADLPVGLMTWLLQRRLLLQLHTYVSFVPCDLDSLSTGSSDKLISSETVEASAALPQLPARVKEKICEEGQLAIQQIPHAADQADLSLFADLLDCVEPESCHIEHLAHYLDRSRSEIVTLIDKFKPVLVTTLLPDRASQHFFGCS